jgi:hypothetical protein
MSSFFRTKFLRNVLKFWVFDQKEFGRKASLNFLAKLTKSFSFTNLLVESTMWQSAIPTTLFSEILRHYLDFLHNSFACTAKVAQKLLVKLTPTSNRSSKRIKCIAVVLNFFLPYRFSTWVPQILGVESENKV